MLPSKMCWELSTKKSCEFTSRFQEEMDLGASTGHSRWDSERWLINSNVCLGLRCRNMGRLHGPDLYVECRRGAELGNQHDGFK